MTAPLNGKVAFITGVARGQGRAHALRLAGEGADIIGIDICAPIAGVGYKLSDRTDLEATSNMVGNLGRKMICDVADVREMDQLRRTLEKGISELGRLDFVIANAGVMPMFGPESQDMGAWNMCLDVMLTGTLNTVELTYPQLVGQAEGGSIVITSSMAALVPMMRTEHAHTLGSLGYSAAKAALINLARNYASFLAPHGIRVNTVHPTGVNTPMVKNDMVDAYFAQADPEDLKTLVNAIPVDTIQPEDVAAAVSWLCSNDSRYYTGNVMRIDAGASLR
jgi:SDR family mycofactocin-dependent oxidoreductase